jgi:hypothetical protein
VNDRVVDLKPTVLDEISGSHGDEYEDDAPYSLVDID